jgi:hypothetical protein
MGNALPCSNGGDQLTGGSGVVWTGGPSAGCPEEKRASTAKLAATSKVRTVQMGPTRAMNNPHRAAYAVSSDWREFADFSGNADYSQYRMGKERESKEKTSCRSRKTTPFPPRVFPIPYPNQQWDSSAKSKTWLAEGTV